MAVKIGNLDISAFKVGSADTKVYLGDTLLYPTAPPSFQGKWLATYSDSHTESAECDSSSAITQGEINLTNLVTVEIGSNCVTSIGEFAFFDCSTLTSCTIGSGVTTIGNDAFDTCHSLTNIDIPDSVTSIGRYAFFDCSTLTSCTIGSGVTSIGDEAFNGCSGLTSIDIPSGATNIGTSAFQNCTSLTSITVNATTPPTLDNVSAFNNTNNCPIYVPSASVEAYKAASGWSTYASRIQPIPTPTFNGKWIGYYSDSTSYSADCDSSSAITKNEVRSGNYTAYTKVIIGDCVTSIREAFQRCSSMTEVEIGSGVTTDLYYSFEDCSALTSVTWYATNIASQDGGFQRCSSLQKFVMYATTPPSVSPTVFNGVPSSMIIYVPDEAITTYQNASRWSNYTIKGHSEL